MDSKNVSRKSKSKHFYIFRVFYRGTEKSRILFSHMLSLFPHCYHSSFLSIYSMFCQLNYSLDLVYVSEFFTSVVLLMMFPVHRMFFSASRVLSLPKASITHSSKYFLAHRIFPNWISSLPSLN